MKKIKVLQVTGGTLIKRGVEKYLQNVNVELDHEQFCLDILTPGVCLNRELKTDIETSGGKIIELNSSKNKCFFYIDFYRKLKKYLREYEYDVVESQTGSIPIMALTTFVAQKRGIKTVIAHSQNTHEKTWKYKLQKFLFMNLLKNADLFFACSLNAGLDSFPVSVHSEIKVIPNAIDVARYQFSMEKRVEWRKKLKIEEQFVIGHVGAFTRQKNHLFLIDILSQVVIYEDCCKLLLIGEGELKHDIEKVVREKNLEKNVIFYGNSDNIPELLNCMDVFVFPSTWEGLGIAVVEAQANGLRTVYSSSLPEEVHINDNCIALDLNEGVDIWAKKVLERSKELLEDRRKYNDIVCCSDFSMKRVVEELQHVYRGNK